MTYCMDLRSTSVSGWLRVLSLLLAIGAGVLGTGCGVPWKVVKESGPPSALAGARVVAVEFDYAQLVIEGKTETDWVAAQKAKDPDYEKTWGDLKTRFESTYLAGFGEEWGGVARLADGATKPAGTIVVQVKVNSLEMAHYNPFSNAKSQVTVNVVWTAEAPDDEIMITASDRPSLVNVSIFQHVGHIGDYLGKVSAKFLRSKQ